MKQPFCTNQRVQSINYDEDGSIESVYFYPPKQPTTPPTIYTLTKTVDNKTIVIGKNTSLKRIVQG